MTKLCKAAVLGTNSEDAPSPHLEFLTQIADLKSFTTDATQQINREVAFCMSSLAELKTSFERTRGDGAETDEPPSKPEENEEIQELQTKPRRTSDKFKLYNPPEEQKTVEARIVDVILEEKNKKQGEKPPKKSSLFKIYDFNAPRKEHDKGNNFKVHEINILPAEPEKEQPLLRKSRRLSLFSDQCAPQVQNDDYKFTIPWMTITKKISKEANPRVEAIKKKGNSGATEILKKIDTNSVAKPQGFWDLDDIPLLQRINSGVSEKLCFKGQDDKHPKMLANLQQQTIVDSSGRSQVDRSSEAQDYPRSPKRAAKEAPIRKKKLCKVTFDENIQYKVISPRPGKCGRTKADCDEVWKL